MNFEEYTGLISCGIFADRETVQEAHQYAFDILKAEGCPEMVIHTALGVLMNTIAKDIKEIADEDATQESE